MDETATTETVAAAELRQFIERIERLEEEKAAISGDIKDVMGEAKGRGYDTKASAPSFVCARRTPTSVSRKKRSCRPIWPSLEWNN